jgi:hypothetical protein
MEGYFENVMNKAEGAISGVMGKSGGGRKKKRRGSRSRRGKLMKANSCKRGGSSVVSTAALPFGLLALQKMLQSTKRNRKTYRNKKSRRKYKR